MFNACPSSGAGAGADTLQADGVAELFFRDPAAMQQAFTSPQSAALREDEPRFLGHSTGYTSPATMCDPPSRMAAS